MHEFIRLPLMDGDLDVDPFAVKAIAPCEDAPTYSVMHVAGAGTFEVWMPQRELVAKITDARMGGRGSATVKAAAGTYPHPVPARSGW